MFTFYQVFNGVHVMFKFYQDFSGVHVMFRFYQVFSGVQTQSLGSIKVLVGFM